MTIERLYAVSDIHGHAAQLRAVLDHIDLDGDPHAALILLGDYVDRGPDSYGVLAQVREVQQRHPDRVVALLGNHDAWLLDWLGESHDDLHWLLDDGFKTLRSFLSPAEMAEAMGHNDPERWDFTRLPGAVVNRNLKDTMQRHHRSLLRWLRDLPRVHETEHHIWVHAGIDEEAGDLWKAVTPPYVMTEKYPPSRGAHNLGKIIVAGHVRTAELHRDPNRHGVFADEGHIYIDGSVEVTGRLNVLCVRGDGSWTEASI
ncbi:metallophosphoesterase [Leucobacter sp. GX24907]